jgi:hypothetical protein
VENGLDKITVISQAVFADLARAIKLPVTSSLTEVNLPTPVANQLIGWNATGDDLATYSFAVITTDLDTIFTTLTSGDFLTYDGTVWRNRAKGSVPMDGAQATGSAGLSLKNSGGTTVLNVGAGGGTGATFAGGVNLTGELTVNGTSASAGYIMLGEDTDNGTNKVTIIAPASIASDYTLTLPSTAGTLARIEDIPNGTINLQTSVATTSGTTVNLSTAIPAGVNRVNIVFSGVSVSGTSTPALRIGSTSFATSGYTSSASLFSGSVVTASAVDRFVLANSGAATYAYNGTITLTRLTGNNWVLSSNLGNVVTVALNAVANGVISLGGVLDRVQLISANGTDTFDAGSASISWEF